jgi:hypothetical protein
MLICEKQISPVLNLLGQISLAPTLARLNLNAIGSATRLNARSYKARRSPAQSCGGSPLSVQR